METRLRLREHEGRVLARDSGTMVVDAVQGLAATLRPRIPQVSRTDDVVEVRNFIGSVRMSDGTVLEVEPKLRVDELGRMPSCNYSTGLPHFRYGFPAVEARGRAPRSHCRYRVRVRAPIGARSVERRPPAGLRAAGAHLKTTERTTRHRGLHPQRVARSDAVPDSSGRTHGGQRLRTRALTGVKRLPTIRYGPGVSSKLLRLESAVIPGHALPGYLNPVAAGRRMPAQWATTARRGTSRRRF